MSNYTDEMNDTSLALGDFVAVTADDGSDFDGDTARLRRDFNNNDPTYGYWFLPGVTSADFNYFLALFDPGPIGAVDFASSADGASFSSLTPSTSTDNGPTSSVAFEKWDYALLPPAGTNVLRASLTAGVFGSGSCQLGRLTATITPPTVVQADGGSGVALTNMSSTPPASETPDTAVVQRTSPTSDGVVTVGIPAGTGCVGVSWHHYPQDPSPAAANPIIESSPDGSTWTSQTVGHIGHGQQGGVRRHRYSIAVLPAGTTHARLTWPGDSSGQNIQIYVGAMSFGPATAGGASLFRRTHGVRAGSRGPAPRLIGV